jgi:hypothetical protein
MEVPTVYGTTGQITALLDGSITRDFLNSRSDIGGKCVAEYVWIGGTGQDLRSKARCA